MIHAAYFVMFAGLAMLAVATVIVMVDDDGGDVADFTHRRIAAGCLVGFAACLVGFAALVAVARLS